MLHTIGLIPGIITIITLGIIATYTAYILIQFYRAYPQIRDIVDVAKIMGGRPLGIIVGVANVLNFCLTCASANVTLSIGFNTISNHALCTVGFIGLPMIACWLLCMPRTMSFAGWFAIPATISIRESSSALSRRHPKLTKTPPQSAPYSSQSSPSASTDPTWTPSATTANPPTSLS